MVETLLSNDASISDYRRMETEKDSAAIVQFLQNRFIERYIVPMRIDKEKKNGFTIMAVSCLMIEALESFYRGWPDSRNRSKLAFYNFFNRNPEFIFIQGYSEEFYQHVRCGILHQAEATGGWHIRRDGIIFQEETKTINAKLFHDKVELALQHYCQALKSVKWDDVLWKHLRKKMDAICKNCEAQ